MKYLVCFVIITLFTSCGALPQLFQASEDIADDTAIKTEISKEALGKDTNIDISIKVSNRESKIIP